MAVLGISMLKNLKLKNFKNIKVGNKVIIGFVLVCVLAAIGWGIVYIAARSLEHKVGQVRNMETTMTTLADLQLTISRIGYPVYDVLNTKTMTDNKEYNELYANANHALDALKDDFQDNAKAQAVITELKRDLATLNAKAGVVFKTFNTPEAGQNAEQFDKVVDQTINAAQKLHNRLIAAQKSDMTSLEDTVALLKNIQLMTVILVLIISVLLIIYVRKTVVDKLRDSFKHVENAVRSLAVISGEISSSSQVVNNATSQIATSIFQVANEASEQSKTTNEALLITEQIKAAVDQVAIGAQSQASSVSDTVGGVNKLAAAIEKVSENARAVAEVASETSETANHGKETVEKAIDGMQKIKETVLDSASKIQALGEKSKQIGEIIEVIDDIAEQTNLLALNAAIEAARAGEHGKGFAVVADEVRKLAERSARATGEIAELIKGIQSETMAAVSAMEKGTAEVESGGKLAQNAGAAIAEMMAAIKQVVMQIAQVSKKADQMAAASSQVSNAIGQIAAVSEENSATTEEVASSVSQLVNAVDSIAAISQESAASAEEVSASAEEQSASVQEIASHVQALAAMSDELDKLVASFNL
jgi:methyl-accepting chemotaxis protein